jgi:hypothetical protein
MHEHGLARELWPQLKQVADRAGFERVTRVEMIVGSLHGVSADFLAHSFEHAFEGTNFEGAEIQIDLVDPGDQVDAPGRSDTMVANGFDLVIKRIEGRKRPGAE